MRNKNLVVDVGNTKIDFGIFENHKLIKKISFSSKEFKQDGRLILEKKEYFKKNSFGWVLVCSVVPGIENAIGNYFKDKINVSVKIIGKDIIVPVKNLYDKPEQVGQDRLVNAFAINKLYKVPAVVIDFGTALTFDVINKNGGYEGGIIFPGIDISIDALVKKTALLPQIDRGEITTSLIGKDTVSSMKSGIFYGFGYLTISIIKALKKQIGGKNIIIVATGGAVNQLKRILKGNINVFDENLTLRGLNLIGEKHIN